MGWSATIFVVLSGIFYVCLCDDKMEQCSAQQMVALTENYLKYAVVSECIWSMSPVSSSHLDAGNMKRIGMMLMTTVQPLCKVSQIIKNTWKNHLLLITWKLRADVWMFIVADKVRQSVGRGLLVNTIVETISSARHWSWSQEPIRCPLIANIASVLNDQSAYSQRTCQGWVGIVQPWLNGFLRRNISTWCWRLQNIEILTICIPRL